MESWDHSLHSHKSSFELPNLVLIDIGYAPPKPQQHPMLTLWSMQAGCGKSLCYQVLLFMINGVAKPGLPRLRWYEFSLIWNLIWKKCICELSELVLEANPWVGTFWLYLFNQKQLVLILCIEPFYIHVHSHILYNTHSAPLIVLSH